LSFGTFFCKGVVELIDNKIALQMVEELEG
jgi:hypothetical protein